MKKFIKILIVSLIALAITVNLAEKLGDWWVKKERARKHDKQINSLMLKNK